MADSPTLADEMVNADLNEDAEFLLAKEIAGLIRLITDTGLSVPIPDSARRFSERVFSEWLEDAASVGRARSSIPYLASRDEFIHGSILDPDFEWNQGISLADLTDVMDDRTDEDPSSLMDFPSLDAKGIFASMMNIRGQLATGPLSAQYNRFLPMKLSLRVLLVLIFGAEKYDGDYHIIQPEIHIEDLRSESLKVALYGKKWFQQLDTLANIEVGAKISVGFPDPDDKTKKSHERFVSQFVGSVRNKGSGSLCEMGFIIVNDEGIVQMTREGYFFASLENPIIDITPQAKRGTRMSLNERLFLIKHIRTHLPDEWSLMGQVAIIMEGENNHPALIDGLIETEFDFSLGKATNMRHGVVSRMQELELVTRVKEGREVTYQLTEFGRNCKMIEDYYKRSSEFS